ncbi:hypothetical protein [Spirosoma flavum]|uniref:Uncharacterized protein n=1 Tax=Spirosoma flavum TaxID=2048557 RepID=A0ABW6AL88_9BACT
MIRIGARLWRKYRYRNKSLTYGNDHHYWLNVEVERTKNKAAVQEMA